MAEMSLGHAIPQFLLLLTLSLCGTLASAQEPTVSAADRTALNQADIAGSKQDPAAVARGTQVYAQSCAGCHGAAGKGGPGAPNLIRSLLVLDDEKGIMIAPVIREGRPDKGMPKLALSEAQIADVVAWLHLRTYSAGHRENYLFGNVLTGDARKGSAYFAAKCSSCHSVAGDLKGIGKKYDPFALQLRWLHPRGKSSAAAPKVTVTTAAGETVSGKLDRINDFTVSLFDDSGAFHSFFRDGAAPRVEVHDPLRAHMDLLRLYSDTDIHNVTAYLVTLK